MGYDGTTTYSVGFTPGTGAMREDLTDVIENVSPKDTPFFSTFGDEPIAEPTHEWLEDSLAARAANAAAEGADFTFAVRAGPSRLSNWCQILTKTVKVSGTANKANLAGMSTLYAYDMAIRMAELAGDAEYAMVNGTGNSGASGTARTMKGILAFITTNDYTASAARDLTPALVDQAMQDMWDSGAAPSSWKLFCGGWQKRKIAGWTTSNTRNVEASSGKIIETVDTYDGPLGLITIVLSRDMPTDEVVLLDVPRWKKGFYRPFTESRAPAGVGDYIAGALVGEFTIIARAEKLSAEIATLTTS